MQSSMYIIGHVLSHSFTVLKKLLEFNENIVSTTLTFCVTFQILRTTSTQVNVVQALYSYIL